MIPTRRRLLAFTVTLLVTLAIALPTVTAAGGDQAVTGGWFYPQAGPGDGTGYTVADIDNQAFFTTFTNAGRVNAMGYPISRRYEYNGFVRQAFQRAVLQWDPNTGAITFANLIDEVGDRDGSVDGLPIADWLLSRWQIPATADWSGDAGLPWPEVVDAHLALLDQNPAIAARFYAVPNWLELYGLPMAYADLGPVRTLRAQRAVFQHWTDAGPWGPAGSVVLANVGDLAGGAGVFSDASRVAHGADTIPDPAAGSTAPPPPPAPPTTYTPTVLAVDSRAEVPGIAIAAEVNAFVESTAAVWGWRPTVPVTFYLHGTRAGFSAGVEQVLGQPIDRQFYENNIAAVAIKTDVLTGGRAVVFKLERADGTLQDDIEIIRVILAHEYTHILQYENTGSLATTWFVEGMANVVAFSNFPLGVGLYEYDTRVPAALGNGTLPSVRLLHENWASFGGSLADLNLAYGTAYYVVNFLANRVGGMTLMQILSDLDTGLTFEQALDARTGFNLDTLDGAFKEWMWATLMSPVSPRLYSDPFPNGLYSNSPSPTILLHTAPLGS